MKIQSLCTIANDNDWKSLENLLQSICIYNPFTPIFISATQNIVTQIMASELSDGRIQIKLNIINNSNYIDQELENIIDIALERHTNTFYINVNSFFSQDVKNIQFLTPIYKHKYFLFAERNKTLPKTSDLVAKNKIFDNSFFVDITNAKYAIDEDINKVLVFLSLLNNSEGKYYNNYVHNIFKKAVLQNYKIITLSKNK